MGDYLSWLDGAHTDHAVKARNEAMKEVGWVLAGVAGSSLVLGGIEGYNHAKDPVKGGMPNIIGPVDLDGLVGAGGILLAILAGDKLGETGQLLTLGIGLGGAGSQLSHWGRTLGVKMYQPASTKGHTSTGALKEKSNLSPATQRVYDEYMTKAA